jgi:hypothetical protein
METKRQIPKAAFSEMMSAYCYFDKVDEGCGYDRLNARMEMIQEKYDLTDDELAIVEKWAYKKYYCQGKNF